MSDERETLKIGIKPHFAVAERRIDELAEAIYIYTLHMTNENTRKLIREFATEIICQCNLVDAMYAKKEEV